MDSHKIIIWDDNACLGNRNASSIGAWHNSLDRRQTWYCIVSAPLQKKIDCHWTESRQTPHLCNGTLRGFGAPRSNAWEIGPTMSIIMRSIYLLKVNKGRYVCKVEKNLKGSLDLILSPSVKIQIMRRTVCLKCKGKTLLAVGFWIWKVCWQRPAMFCLYTSSKHSRPWFEFSLMVMWLNPGYLLNFFIL